MRNRKNETNYHQTPTRGGVAVDLHPLVLRWLVLDATLSDVRRNPVKPMRSVTKIHEVRDLEKVNEMLSHPERYKLYERVVQGESIVFYIAEIRNHTNHLSEGD